MKNSISIKAYLSISYAILLVLSLGIIGFIWSRNEYQVIIRELENMMDDRVTLLANIISHEIAEHDKLELEEKEFSLINQEKNLLAVYFDDSGKYHELIPGTVSSVHEQIIRQIYTEHPIYEDVNVSVFHSEVESSFIYAAAPVRDTQNRSIGTVCLFMPISYLDIYITRLRWLLVGAILVLASLGIAAGFIVTNYLSRQFSQAKELAATVSSGNYQLRIPLSGPTELRDLSHYLNVMAEKLQEQLVTRQRLLSNVSHELARPLAGIRLGIESLRKGAIQDPDLADDLLVSMDKTIRRFESLIDDITLAAKPESSPIELHRTSVAVEPYLQGVAINFWSLAHSREIKLSIQVEQGLPAIYADEKRLNQIIGNLLDNAIKFSPPGSTIRISAHREDASDIRLAVHDGGRGITPDEAEHVFEPFYQGDFGRRIKQGMGLGLSIAYQLAVAHDGSLTLQNHPDGGLIAVLILPISND